MSINKILFNKSLAIGIIVLFIGVGIHPAFAVDTNHSIVSGEDCGCKKVSNNDFFPIICKILKSIFEPIDDNLDYYYELLQNQSKFSILYILYFSKMMVYFGISYVTYTLAAWLFFCDWARPGPVVSIGLKKPYPLKDVEVEI